MKRFLDVLGTIYWSLALAWIGAGIAFNIMMIVFAIKGRWEALVLLALWWIITVSVHFIRNSIEKRHERKLDEKAAAYRKEFITEIPVESELFGRVVFDYDSNINSVMADEYKIEKPLGRHKLTLNADISGSDPTAAVKALEYVYSHSEELLREVYEYTVTACENYDERNKNGELYDLTYVSERLDLFYIFVEDYNESVYAKIIGAICGEDGEDLLGCHSIVELISFRKGDTLTPEQTDCFLEG